MISKAVKYDRGSPTIVIRCTSKRVDRAVLRRGVEAIQKQVDRDFFPLWGWRARLLLEPKRAPADAMQITIRERERGNSDHGYHFIDGLPHTRVFVRNADGDPVDYFPTLSHEVLEMIADPGVNLFAEGYFKYRGRRVKGYVAYEVCDPVQENLYAIDGVKVSDFVTPEWFEPERQPGSLKFSFKDAVDRPFRAAPQGYFDAIYRGRMRTIWGEEANTKKVRHRKKARLERHKG